MSKPTAETIWDSTAETTWDSTFNATYQAHIKITTFRSRGEVAAATDGIYPDLDVYDWVTLKWDSAFTRATSDWDAFNWDTRAWGSLPTPDGNRRP